MKQKCERKEGQAYQDDLLLYFLYCVANTWIIIIIKLLFS